IATVQSPDAITTSSEKETKSIAAPNGFVRARAVFERHRISFVASSLILVAAAAATAYLVGGSKAANTSSAIESIAVLPFVNEASDSDAEYFSDEITESLINNLSQLPKLRVVPRSFVADYRNHPSDPRKIARDLNVRAVLTGRVHRRGDTLSIQVDLIDVASASQ